MYVRGVQKQQPISLGLSLYAERMAIASAFLFVLGFYCVASASIRYDYFLHKNDTRLLSSNDNNLVTVCNKEDDSKRVKPKSLDVTPNPPKKGEKVKISVDILLLEKVTSGEVKVTLKYGNIPIVDETLDLCDLITQINRSCPLDANKDVKFSTEHSIPDYVPSGKYEGEVKMTDQNGKELICLKLNLSI